jgi:hypothetical protein
MLPVRLTIGEKRLALMAAEIDSANLDKIVLMSA